MCGLEDAEFAVVGGCAAGGEGVFAVAEEVLAYLRVPEGDHVRGAAVDAAAGFVDAQHCHGLVAGTGRRELLGEVGVETFRAEGDEDVDWEGVSLRADLRCVESWAGQRDMYGDEDIT